MGAPISDKIRKLHDAGQAVRPGPGHAGFYIDKEGNLMVFINEDDGPRQVDTLEGDTLSAVKRIAQAFLDVYEDDGQAIVLDAGNNAIYIGAYRDKDTNDLIATRVSVLKIENLDDSSGAFSISVFPAQTPGDPVDEEAVGTFGFSASSENMFFGEDKVEHGTPKNFVAAGAVAGDVTVTGVGANDLLVSVIVFTAGVPSDLTAEFSITADNTINNTGGTSTATKTLIVSVLSRA